MNFSPLSVIISLINLLILIDGEINRSDNCNNSVDTDENNNNIVKNKKVIDNKASIHISCNLIDYAYVNENNINSLYRIRNEAGTISIEHFH